MGPWATGWLLSVCAALRGHDGSRPIFPFGRVVRPEPVGGIAGVIVWPWGYFTPSGEDGANSRTYLWLLLPIFPDELARFRADPAAAEAWIADRRSRRDFDDAHRRWSGRA